MNTKLLRQKVLDLAIHGKLLDKAVVEALETTPGYEPASKLLERIRGESLPLATAGNPSSAAPSAGSNAARNARSNPISEDEFPFEIPENWCWCRLGDLGTYKKGPFGSALTKSMFVPKGENTIKVYEQKNAIQKNHSLGDYYITKEYYESNMKSFSVAAGDILVSCAGTIGETYILPDDIEPGIINQALMKMTITKEINITYFLYYFDHILKEAAIESGKGTAIKNIPPFAIFKNFQFPLPPLEEQKLIVEKIERIFALIDTVEQNKTDLETVIKQTKSKILDLAIHGKLVPQDKAEEPASKMLEKLRAEKEEKIANGQLKRDKNDSYIYKSANGKWLERKADGSEEEIEVPFEIPENWSWSKIKNIALDMADGPFGSNLKTEHYTTEQEARLIQLSNIGEEGWREDNTKYTTFEHAKTYISRSIVEPGNIVIAKMMPAGRAIICPDHEKMFVLSSDAVRLVPSELLCVEYLLKAINSPTFRESVTDKVQGSTRMRTSISKLKECFIPIPPLEEQKRIISKIKSIGNDIKVILKNIEG